MSGAECLIYQSGPSYDELKCALQVFKGSKQPQTHFVGIPVPL